MGNLIEALEELDNYPDGEDPSSLFRHVTGKEITKTGTNSVVGYAKFKPIDLIMTFGLPTESDSYKYSGGYTFQHFNGDYLQLYEWKNTSLLYGDGIKPIDFWKQDTEIEFNIAGSNGWHWSELEEWIQFQIKKNELKINTEGFSSGFDYEE